VPIEPKTSRARIGIGTLDEKVSITNWNISPETRDSDGFGVAVCSMLMRVVSL
jgi:hypothetical protein